MDANRGIRRTLLTLAAATGLVAGAAPGALAAPGDWTQLSQISSATTFPKVGNIDEPTTAWFGSSLQVLWPQAQGSNAQTYFTAILDSAGNVTSPASQVFPEWTSVSNKPTLISLAGQRFLSFAGLTTGLSGAQHSATSPDGLSWTIDPGSMSATQSAYAGYGSDVVDSAGVPVWVGNAGSTRGIQWHVGTSASDPAPPGSDQSYTLSGCCAYSAAAARDDATGAVYAAFYSNSSATTENGTHVGQILPASAGWRQAPGSTDIQNGRAASVAPDQTVAMVGRPGGGVYVAYTVGYPTTKRIRVYNAVTGTVLDVPGSTGAQDVAMSAEPDGRLWLTWHRGTQVVTVHSNAAATRFGTVGRWTPPGGTEYVWKTAIAGNSGGASVVITATTQNAINVWHTKVARTLTVTASATSVRRGAKVRFTVTDAGDPVAGAKVKFGSRTRTTNAAGKVRIAAPGSPGRVKVTAKKDAFNPGSAVVRVR